MALRTPFDLTPRGRPIWRSGLTTPQVGPLGEDLLAVTLTAAAGGLGSLAWPRVDRGIDMYLRRLRSLLTIPVQVKSFRTLTPDGGVTLELPAENVLNHPNAYLAIVHLPAPHDILYDRLFLIPFSEFRRRCPRRMSGGEDVYAFESNFVGDAGRLWSDFAIKAEDLPAWFDAIPGWPDTVPPVPRTLLETTDLRKDGRSIWQGDLGRLWAAAEIERAAGPAAVIIAEDRVRVDHVTLLFHDLRRQQIAGLNVHTAKITPPGRMHLQMRRDRFFLDPKFYVLLMPIGDDDRPHSFCLLMPSSELPRLGFAELITLEPLTKRFIEYRVPTDQLGSTFLSKVFGS